MGTTGESGESRKKSSPKRKHFVGFVLNENFDSSVLGISVSTNQFDNADGSKLTGSKDSNFIGADLGICVLVPNTQVA